MKTYQITPLHINAGTYNGQLFFLLDGRLLTITFGTPCFNDYNEWRLKEVKLSSEPYKMEDNLTPFSFEPITITQDELDMLSLVFGSEDNVSDEDCDLFVRNILDWEDRNSCYINPLRYIQGYEEVLTSINGNSDQLVHILFDSICSKDEDTDNEWESETGDYIENKDWTPKGNFAYYHGLYDFLIPAINSLMNYYKDDNTLKTNEIFIV